MQIDACRGRAIALVVHWVELAAGISLFAKVLSPSLAIAAMRYVPQAAGFYTEECRSNGDRVGFGVVALGCRKSGTLAATVGKYVVDVASFERVALPSLARAATAPVTLIDGSSRLT